MNNAALMIADVTVDANTRRKSRERHRPPSPCLGSIDHPGSTRLGPACIDLRWPALPYKLELVDRTLEPEGP